MFELWAGKVELMIEGGLTYGQLQEIILIEVAKLNKEAGMALLLVSGSIFAFEGEQSPIKEMDKKLRLMSLEDLRAQVKRMALIAS
jgi:hypothetical protein